MSYFTICYGVHTGADGCPQCRARLQGIAFRVLSASGELGNGFCCQLCARQWMMTRYTHWTQITLGSFRMKHPRFFLKPLAVGS